MRSYFSLNETKSNKTEKKKRNDATREKQYGIGNYKTPGGHKFAPLLANQLCMVSEPARTRLLSAILILVVPVTFRHTAACRTAAVHLAVKRSASCSAVLRHPPSFWATYSRPLVCGNTESSEIIQETPHPLVCLPPHAARAPHRFSKHYALRQSRVLHVRHNDCAATRIRILCTIPSITSRLHEGVQIANWVIGAIVLLPTDAARQEAVVGSAEGVVVVRARAPRDAAVQY